MVQITYTLRLDMRDTGIVNTSLRLKQGDSGMKIAVNVFNGGVSAFDSSTTPKIVFRRPDGASVMADMTVESSLYSYTLVGNELQVPGKELIDIKFPIGAEGRESTMSCSIEVVPDTITPNTHGSGIYDNDLAELVEEATEAAETVQEVVGDSEAWANGERNGVPVGPDDPAYHNNSKYWSEQANPTALANLTDVDVDGVANGDVLQYNSSTQKWEGKSISSGTNEIIAPVEGATSLHAYVVGEQLIYNDTLYKVIAPIAVNDALVVNTNIEVSPKTVIEQVEDNAEGIEELNDAWQKNGAYNLANCVADTEVKSGFTLTKVVDSNTGGVTYTISGTDSGSTGTQYIVANDAELLATMKHYAGTKVKLVGCPTGGDTTNGYFVAIYFNYGAGDVPVTYNDIGDGIEVSVPATVNTARLAITLRHNANPSGKTFKPMITTDLNATYDDYVEYAKTNRELTEVKTITGVSVTSTSYTLLNASVTRVGNIVQLFFVINIPNGLTAGANADGTLSGLPLPIMNCQGDTYTQTRTVGWLIQTDGLLRIRAVDTLPTNEYVAVAATYICK